LDAYFVCKTNILRTYGLSKYLLETRTKIVTKLHHVVNMKQHCFGCVGLVTAAPSFEWFGNCDGLYKVKIDNDSRIRRYPTVCTV